MPEEIMYDHSSLAIALVLLILILAANEAGFRVGRHVQRQSDAELKAQTNAIQAGMLGLLALLLGFTFSMALQRFDSRSEAVIAEANAIGTALLRTELLPPEHRAPIRELLDEYVAVRVTISSVDLTRVEERTSLDDRAVALQEALWRSTAAVAAADPNPVTTGLFAQALNEVIDAHGRRTAILQRHVPEVVLFLLFGVFITAGGILGYASGLGGRRPVLAAVLMNLLIVMVVFIIVDLDRPKRGLIQVDQSSLTNLAAPRPPPGT